MLLSLHVKNLALIKDIDVSFEKGLNILTGETGAGKSLLLGSINIALGAKFSKDIIRNEEESALVELIFENNDSLREILSKYDIDASDDIIIVSRKINNNKSISKINGFTVTVKDLKNIMLNMLDISGQHEHQKLLSKETHLDIVDEYAKDKTKPILTKLKDLYEEYKYLLKLKDEFNIDESSKNREIDILQFEINEIDQKIFMKDEDDALEEEFKKLNSGTDICEDLNKAYSILQGDNGGVSSALEDALSYVNDAYKYDDGLSDLKDSLYELDSLCKDLTRDLYQKLEDVSVDEERLSEVSERLDEINHLKMKYGNTYESIINYLNEKKEQLDFYLDYDNRLKEHEEKIEKCKCEIISLCDKLTDIRIKTAKVLKGKITDVLLELNFLDVKFDIVVNNKDDFNAKGNNEVIFMISTNPGSDIRPINEVASGGELSRIMLAIKTVLASVDDVDTLIFDEIDSGISGITASMVAKKLCDVSKYRQVICITHLAQIAAMADLHLRIDKNVIDNNTYTTLTKLDYDESIAELMRISGNEKLTDTDKAHAVSLKQSCDEYKKGQ
ncbi:MAG TPA: DNA repair protein RecN [Eubacterium sp.]|nr:DNA repair protein RecN [Eubacterium sp.]